LPSGPSIARRTAAVRSPSRSPPDCLDAPSFGAPRRGRSEAIIEHRPIDFASTSLSSCFWCTTLHPAAHALSVCAPCTAAYKGEQFAMRSLEMERSYPLEADTVDEIVSRHAPGNYALGYLEGATFTVFYVGHSDSDVWHSLRAWVGRPSHPERHGSAMPASRGCRTLRRTPWDALLPMSVGSDAPSPYTRFAYNYARPPDAPFATGPRGFDELCGRLGRGNEVAHPRAAIAHERFAHSA
jgi:hypothetical protein